MPFSQLHELRIPISEESYFFFFLKGETYVYYYTIFNG